MKRLVVFIAAVGCLIAARIAPSIAEEKASEVQIVEELVAVDASRLKAMIDVDTDVLASVLSDNMTYTHSNGMVQTKTELIEALAGGVLDYLHIEPSATDIRVYDDTAVVTGLSAVKVKVGEASHNMNLRYLCVYVQDGDDWRMVAYQSTRQPEPEN